MKLPKCVVESCLPALRAVATESRLCKARSVWAAGGCWAGSIDCLSCSSLFCALFASSVLMERTRPALAGSYAWSLDRLEVPWALLTP